MELHGEFQLVYNSVKLASHLNFTAEVSIALHYCNSVDVVQVASILFGTKGP